MMMMRPPLLLAASFVVCSAQSTDAFSVPAPSDGIKIVGLPGGKIESLPGMYVQSFGRWIVDGKDDGDGRDRDDENGENSCTPLRIEPIEGAGLPTDDGWVNPTTVDELWWPGDLTALQIRPALNVLFRNGNLSYVSAGLDVRVPHASRSWRNYGLNSQPIARMWTTLDIAMESIFHVETFVLENDEHEELLPSLDLREVLPKVATFIAELDSDSPLAKGFHIASFPMMENWTDLPPPKASVEEGAEEPLYKIVCLGTSEPFANKLLDMDEDILTMSSTSVLEVLVSRTAKGGESEYLPEPYKVLYLNE